MKKTLLTSIALLMINLGFTQGTLTSSDNSDTKVKSVLSACSCSELIIPDGVTINMADQWLLQAQDIVLRIQGSGSLVFSGNGGSRDELHMSSNSILYVENKSNSSALTAGGGGGQLRIEIGGFTFKGNDLPSIITAGGANLDGPLPIELSYFKGNQGGTEVVLSWATLTEKNNDRIEILRSQDLETWEVIGEVEGNGTTNDLREYSFIDEQPKSGDNYYLLKQYDYNGDLEEHKIIIVKYLNKIGVYPNPTQGNVTIHLQEFHRNEVFNFEIMNMNNTIVSSGTVSNGQSNLDLDIEDGIYILRVYNAGTSYNVKLKVE